MTSIVGGASLIRFALEYRILDYSCVKSRGNLKVECAMRPQLNNVTAIPEVAVACVAFASNISQIKLMRSVFPVPPGASKNVMLPSPE